MSLILLLAAVTAMALLVAAMAQLGAARWGLSPVLLLAVLGLPLLDSALRHLGLPLLFPGCGYLLLPLGIWAALRAPATVPWCRLGLFTAVLLLALLLRGLAPGFDSFGENIFSLRYVQSLRLANTYPAPDVWQASATVATYYTLIHNLPALLSRALLLPVPLAVSLSLALILATLWTALYESLRTRAGAVWSAVGAGAVLTAGTGVSLLLWSPVHATDSMMLGYPHVRLFDMRPDEFSWPWLQALVQASPSLPVETPLHVAIYLGDLHPPLLTLVMMAMLLWTWAHRAQPGGDARHAAWLAALPWLSWAANPWTVPHVGLLAAGLLLGDPLARRQWRAALVGFGISWALVTPLMLHSALRDSGVSIQGLPAALRSPIPALLIIWGPALLLGLGAALRRDRSTWVLLGIALLALSMEVLHFSQGDNGGSGARFNGVLKVWSPLHFLALGFGVYALAGLRGRARGLWLLAVPLLLSAALHGRDVVWAQWNKGQTAFDWSGADRLTLRADRGFLMRALQHRPHGRTLERLGASAYTLAPLTSMLAGQATVSGWVHHAAQASGDAAAEQRRFEAIRGWYDHAGADALDLPQAWAIDSILVDWDAGWSPARLAVVAAALQSAFSFQPGPAGHDERVSGLFVRRPAEDERR